MFSCWLVMIFSSSSFQRFFCTYISGNIYTEFASSHRCKRSSHLSNDIWVIFSKSKVYRYLYISCRSFTVLHPYPQNDLFWLLLIWKMLCFSPVISFVQEGFLFTQPHLCGIHFSSVALVKQFSAGSLVLLVWFWACVVLWVCRFECLHTSWW